MEHYDFAKDFEFAEVEALDEVHKDDNEKFVTTKLKIARKSALQNFAKEVCLNFLKHLSLIEK